MGIEAHVSELEILQLHSAQQKCLNQVTVVIVTYNSAHCIHSLAAGLKNCPFVIVADNGSKDTTTKELNKHLPQAEVLSLNKNYGFGAANNRALSKVQTPFALILNPDCQITSESIAELVSSANLWPDAAITAPQLLDKTNKLELNYGWPKGLWASRGEGAESATCVGFACGAAMLLRMKCFEDIGFFDEQFFLYYEDDDLCLRLFRAKRNIIIAPEVKVTHLSRGSVKGNKPWQHELLRGYHHAQSKLTFIAKHQSFKEAKNKRLQLISLTLLSLPLRLLLPSPRLIARLVGRLKGTLNWKPHEY